MSPNDLSFTENRLAKSVPTTCRLLKCAFVTAIEESQEKWYRILWLHLASVPGQDPLLFRGAGRTIYRLRAPLL